MVTLSRDTSPDIERMQIEHLRRLPAWRKLALVGEMNRTVQAMALAGLRQRHPDDTREQRRRRLAALLLGSDLATRAYGPAPEEA
ncbi:MAG: hypothetical protein PVI07_15580 [Anaerolineae bacterium]|jgi:hypothetical protein